MLTYGKFPPSRLKLIRAQMARFKTVSSVYLKTPACEVSGENKCGEEVASGGTSELLTRDLQEVLPITIHCCISINQCNILARNHCLCPNASCLFGSQ